MPEAIPADGVAEQDRHEVLRDMREQLREAGAALRGGRVPPYLRQEAPGVLRAPGGGPEEGPGIMKLIGKYL